MKLRDVLVDKLLEIENSTHSDHTAHQNDKKISHANMLKPLHGMLKVSSPYCK